MAVQQIRYEAGQTQYAWAQLTDSGDHKIFASAVSPWSDVGRDYELADVRLYGLATGGQITPGSANDQVAVAAMTLYAPGMTGANATTGLVSVAANSALSVGTRPASTNKCVVSITVDSTGALAVVKGTDNASIVTTRAAAGGPPLIPVGSVEIGQVTLSGTTSAAVVAADISQVVGLSQERYDYPVFSVDRLNGKITLSEALPLIHTGTVARKVYARPAAPVFAPIPNAYDWVPADESASVSSVDTYDGPIGSASRSIGSASFTFVSRDGTSDNLLQQGGASLWVEYKPDSSKSFPKQLTQGLITFSRTNPASGSKAVTVTIVPTVATANLLS